MYLEPPGVRRLDSQNLRDLRVSRVFSLEGDGRRTADLLVGVFNLFNPLADEDIAGRTLGSSVFRVCGHWIDPGRAIVGVRIGF